LPDEQNALSPQGQEQLAHIIGTCRDEGVQTVIHSTQSRAVFAAEALALALDAPSVSQQGLEERDFGDWSDWEWPQIAAELGKLTTDERYTFVPPNGESWQQMEARLRSALTHIATLGYDSVAVVTHWGPIRSILPIVRDEPKESTLQLDVTYGQIFVEGYNPVS